MVPRDVLCGRGDGGLVTEVSWADRPRVVARGERVERVVRMNRIVVVRRQRGRRGPILERGWSVEEIRRVDRHREDVEALAGVAEVKEGLAIRGYVGLIGAVDDVRD